MSIVPAFSLAYTNKIQHFFLVDSRSASWASIIRKCSNGLWSCVRDIISFPYVTWPQTSKSIFKFSCISWIVVTLSVRYLSKAAHSYRFFLFLLCRRILLLAQWPGQCTHFSAALSFSCDQLIAAFSHIRTTSPGMLCPLAANYWPTPMECY